MKTTAIALLIAASLAAPAHAGDAAQQLKSSIDASGWFSDRAEMTELVGPEGTVSVLVIDRVQSMTCVIVQEVASDGEYTYMCRKDVELKAI